MTNKRFPRSACIGLRTHTILLRVLQLTRWDGIENAPIIEYAAGTDFLHPFLIFFACSQRFHSIIYNRIEQLDDKYISHILRQIIIDKNGFEPFRCLVFWGSLTFISPIWPFLVQIRGAHSLHIWLKINDLFGRSSLVLNQRRFSTVFPLFPFFQTMKIGEKVLRNLIFPGAGASPVLIF